MGGSAPNMYTRGINVNRKPGSKMVSPLNNKVEVEIRADERVFTLFCALNATGYDEKRFLRMHPVRRRVREDLRQVDKTVLEEVREFFVSHKCHQCGYVSYVLSLSEPPDFEETSATEMLFQKWKAVSPEYLMTQGFAPVLSGFYKRANISSLWLKYKPYYEAEVKGYRPLLSKAVDEVGKYLRLEEPLKVRRVVFILNLLDKYLIGYGPTIGDTNYVVSGPWPFRTIPVQTIQHEYLHSIINPLVLRNKVLVDKSASLFDLVKEKVVPKAYGVWNTVVVECLINAIVIRLLPCGENLRKLAVYLKRSDGFILVDHFNKKLREFELKEIVIEEYIPEMLTSVNVREEGENYQRLPEIPKKFRFILMMGLVALLLSKQRKVSN
jgi:hypothetical protein